MNDIRRTVLWVVFGFSMVLLWDQWQIYSGHSVTCQRATVSVRMADQPAELHAVR